ncbi:MAG: hypothetical protein SFX73_02400 [Kofleriaceae bacterium]|nr:hypothetical protein [Kofleriaceae bacterium]
MVALSGCNVTGSLELSLSLPTDPSLRPVGMTTVTVTATPPGETPISNTSVVSESGTFAAGELPIGEDVQVGVVLRDVSNRIVGVGDAGELIDIVGDQATKVDIQVRRPFVYASSGTALFSYDPTLDPRDQKFQGRVTGLTNPQLAVSVGGDRLAVVTSTQVQVIQTATNQVVGAITVPMGARDATAVPGTNKLAIAHMTGLTIVDIDTMSASTAMVGPVDRVTVGPSADGTLVAYGLLGRVAAPERPTAMATCAGSSSLVMVNVANPSAATPIPFPASISDIAAAPDTPMLFVTQPCEGQVAKVMGAVEGSTLTLQKVATLSRAALLTVSGDRVWAAGTNVSTPECTETCAPTTQIQCPVQTNEDRLRWVMDGASIAMVSVALTGNDAVTLNLPDRRETAIDTADLALQHAQVLKALSAVPVDLVVLPGGQYISLVTTSRYYVEDFDVSIPCLDVTTADWMLVDMASSSVAQRVRTSCTITQRDVGEDWICDTPPLGQDHAFEAFIPASVGALFGAR